jgi:aldehyde dehydrogenase (NAD+)
MISIIVAKVKNYKMKRTIDKIYINGAFTTPTGTQYADIINPSTNTVIGTVRLADKEDTIKAIHSAKEAFTHFSKTTKEERIAYLQKLHDAVAKRKDELTSIMVREYGGPLQFCKMSTNSILGTFLNAITTVQPFDFITTVGHSKVRLEPVGVVGIITPWNSSNYYICSKLSAAIAAGCTAVIKPSEMSAFQTQILTECLHEAGLPAGVFNFVTGLGNVVGDELSRHPDIAKITFTGSTAVGKMIAHNGVDTMKRVTLELGGKSPNIILEDADLPTALPLAVKAAFLNSGQACIAGTRLLVAEDQFQDIKPLLKTIVENIKVGNPEDADTVIGPMVSRKQYETVQQYITTGMQEGAQILTGGPGHPRGLEAGNFVKPTVFINVDNSMRIAQEEIFGPVLSVITYKSEEEAIRIANDTNYGLQAYISSSNTDRANRVAAQINAGRILINCLNNDPLAPFGGFKQSGIGREYGVYGLEEYLEPKTIII